MDDMRQYIRRYVTHVIIKTDLTKHKVRALSQSAPIPNRTPQGGNLGNLLPSPRLGTDIGCKAKTVILYDTIGQLRCVDRVANHAIKAAAIGARVINNLPVARTPSTDNF